MALFTVVLEFDGGTYISQFRATSVRAAIEKHASQLVGNKAVSTLATRRRLAHDLSADGLVNAPAGGERDLGDVPFIGLVLEFPLCSIWQNDTLDEGPV